MVPAFQGFMSLMGNKTQRGEKYILLKVLKISKTATNRQRRFPQVPEGAIRYNIIINDGPGGYVQELFQSAMEKQDQEISL